MTDLKQSLIKADFSYLKAVADKWDLSFRVPDVKAGLEYLIEGLLSPAFLPQIPDTLTEEERKALLWLEARGGKEVLDRFSRLFGEIRDVGAGKIEREKPHLNPISTAESLWYRALIARGFLEIDEGPREFVFIPEEFRTQLMPILEPKQEIDAPGTFTCRQASEREARIQTPAAADILDHFCTILAALRMSLDPSVQLAGVTESQRGFYQNLARSIGLLDKGFAVKPESVRDFFELSREEAMEILWLHWQSAADLNEVDFLPRIRIEGNPELVPIRVREKTVGYLRSLLSEKWWSIESFISQIKEVDPDLIRKSGEYDTWFIKDIETDEYIKGFKSWNEVEGALVRFLITGPLHWLGFLDLGYADEEGIPLAFRLSKLSSALLEGKKVPLVPRTEQAVQIRSKGEIRMTQNVPHKTRYQVARFCDWYPIRADAYIYAITPGSLRRAEKQGLRIAHLLSLLKNNVKTIPPNILSALQRWEKKGNQAQVARKTVLRLGSPQILKSLKKSKASRYLLEQIGPTAVIIKDGSEGKIQEALVELGFFLDMDVQDGSQT